VLYQARKELGKYTYATYGVGSYTHLAGEVFLTDMGVEFRHIPYKGVEAVTALASGQVDLMVDGVNAAGSMIEAGKTKALVVLQHKRSEFLPDTPTLSEAGYPAAAASTISYVMAAPKGTPAPIIDRLQAAFGEALQDPEVLEQIKTVRTSAAFMGPQETKQFVARQAATFKDIVEKKGIKF
jgi:tripartite-type tricarboxylate transporter receptor subunit TctC